MKLRFPAKKSSAVWDLNVVDDAGLSVRFQKVKLAGADRITLAEVSGKSQAVVEYISTCFEAVGTADGRTG